MATKIVSDNNFDSEVLKSKTPVLVDFWAEWCGPCRGLAPKLEEIATDLGGKLNVFKMNIDENPETPSRYSIRSIPTMIIFKGGEAVEQLMGNLPKENILEAIKKHT